MEDAAHREVLVLGHDHSSCFRSGRANLIIRGLREAQVKDVLSPVAERLNPARQRWRELRVYEKAQSSAPQHRVVVLSSGELKHRGDVLDLQVGVVCQDLFARSPRREQVEHILHTDAKTAHAWTATQATPTCTLVRSTLPYYRE
jgi:hypothetical protein